MLNLAGKTKKIFSVGQKPAPRTGLVQQTDQVAASRDLSLLAVPQLRGFVGFPPHARAQFLPMMLDLLRSFINEAS